MTKDELKLAFQKAFQMGQDYWYYADHEFESYNKKSDAIRAKFNEMVKETIEEALAQPEPWEKFCDSNCVWTDHHPDCKLAEQKPVAWLNEEKKIIYWHNTHETDDYHGFKRTTPLYTTPPQRKPLSNEEIDRLWSQSLADTEGETYLPLREFARAIEAAHNIKGEA